MNNPFYFVFDVESVGLHGEGFEVGYVVVDYDGKRLEERHFAAPLIRAIGSTENREWCSSNIPKTEPTHKSPYDMRQEFWVAWQNWRGLGAVMVTDCGWPVETRFLAQCVDDSPEERQWTGPYPLLELASLGAARGINPLEKTERLADELPEHNPLNDARQSARIWIQMLTKKD